MLFIVTGGTIDKMPSFLSDDKTFDNNSKIFGDTHLPEMLQKARYYEDYSLKQLFMIDSLDMTEEHCQKISKAIDDTDETKIIITHGTDTMTKTASFLKKRGGFEEKTLIFTGAMLPYGLGEQSDALFNIGSSIAFASTLPPRNLYSNEWQSV